jgi:hypothetical protein
MDRGHFYDARYLGRWAGRRFKEKRNRLRSVGDMEVKKSLRKFVLAARSSQRSNRTESE